MAERAAPQRRRPDADTARGPGVLPSLTPSAPGRPLDRDVRARMEAGFGHDFSRVRVHADQRSTAAARSVGALAFTTGTDIVLDADRFSPGTVVGRRLLAHELAHVVQQAGAPAAARTSPTTTGMTAPHHPSERAADAAADAVLSGRSPASAHPVPAGTVQRQHGDVKLAEHREEVFARLRVDHAKARTRNLSLSAASGLGWATKLGAVAGGRYKDLAELWSRAAYDEFADALARVQFDLGFPERELDGVLGLGTWSRMAGLGESMAAISTVSQGLCYEATNARLERAHRLSTGKQLTLPEDRDAQTFKVILASIPPRMLDVDVSYRGTGAAGALVYAGLGTFVPAAQMWTGGLRPGAAMQVWKHQKAYDLLREGQIDVGGKKRRINDSDTDYYGTSFVFVRYDTDTNERLLVRHFDSVEWHRRGDWAVWVAANTTP
jgi:hypothetical protein